jgi:hypothetical protein
MIRTTLALLTLCVPLLAQSHQLSLAGGYNYQNSDQGHGIRVNLNGWFAAAQFDLNNTISLSAEADNYYGSLSGTSMAQQNFIVGPQFTFRDNEAKFRPFVYTQAGDQRSASGDSVDHAFNLQIGGGIQVKLSEDISLQITPAEYTLATPSHMLTHSFSAKIGLSWTVWKSSPKPEQTALRPERLR